MTKRADGKFEKIPNDLYRTWDERAARRLFPHLAPRTQFIEPCAGAGDLIDLLRVGGHRCVGAYDLAPLRADIKPGDATRMRWKTPGRTIFITNPPWTRPALHAIITHLCRQAPVWMLFDADWLFTDQSAPFLRYLRKVVAVGRLRWIPGTTMDGFDNCAWYLFDGTRSATDIIFVGRD